MYTADWNSIKISAAYTYTWMESAALSGFFRAWVLRYRQPVLSGETTLLP